MHFWFSNKEHPGLFEDCVDLFEERSRIIHLMDHPEGKDEIHLFGHADVALLYFTQKNAMRDAMSRFARLSVISSISCCTSTAITFPASPTIFAMPLEK